MAGNNDTLKPPAGLTRKAAAFWRAITAEYCLETHHYELLRQACMSLVRIEECEEALRRDGLTVPDRWGQPREHPAVAIEATNKRLYRQAIRELGLDVSAPDDGYHRASRLPQQGRPKNAIT